MNDDNEKFPRAVFDANNVYTVRIGASYIVDDPRIRELAEIGYARRDLERAHEFVAACASYDENQHILLEQSLWSAAIVSYARPFGKNNARKFFEAEAFVRARLDPVGLRRHNYIRRCRDKWIAHDDGLGESKTVAVYLPPSPPRSRHEIGLHFPGSRVVSLGADIALALAPHIARIRDLIVDHENEFRDRVGADLVANRFAGMQIEGLAVEDELVEDFQSILRLDP